MTTDSGLIKSTKEFVLRMTEVGYIQTKWCYGGLYNLVSQYNTSYNSAFMIMKLGSRRVWSINRGCLLLLGTWSHLRYIRGSVLAHLFLWFVFPTCILRLITLWYLSHFINLCLICFISIFKLFLAHDFGRGLLRLRDLKIDFTAGVTSRYGMLTSTEVLGPTSGTSKDPCLFHSLICIP
jgi:hypothetical protein